MPDLLAVSLGACIIERHITIDRSMKGSDQGLSLDEKGMQELVEGIQQVKTILGNSSKQLLHSEEFSRNKLRNLTLQSSSS